MVQRAVFQSGGSSRDVGGGTLHASALGVLSQGQDASSARDARAGRPEPDAARRTSAHSSQDGVAAGVRRSLVIACPHLLCPLPRPPQAKSVEDKTFGLKNKSKSKAVQQYVASVKAQASHNVAAAGERLQSDAQRMAAEAKKAKVEQERMEKELAMLFRSSIRQPVVPPGVDPKSIVCEFFKNKICEKGDKCKFSHDLTVAKRSLRIDLYADRREGGPEGAPPEEAKEDAIADWDQAKLEQVVKTKHGQEKKGTTTDIVCKFFLDAIEREQYGWFWICPAGGQNCKYRHALPPGYAFRSKKEREEEMAAALEAETNAPDITERIEAERAKLPSTGLTPVTEESFAAWKLKRDERRKVELKTKQEEEVKKIGGAGGRDFKVLSGRALFMVNADLFKDDANADDDVYSQHGDGEEGEGEGEEGEGEEGEEEEEEEGEAGEGEEEEEAKEGEVDEGVEGEEEPVEGEPEEAAG